jgi:cell division protein FtsQ
LQSLINASSADTVHWRASISPPRLDRRQARGNRSGSPAETSLYGWLEAHSGTASKIGFVFCVIFYGLTVAYGVAAGGQWHDVRQAIAVAANDVAIAAGFEVKAVRVKGRQNMTDAQIAAALGPYEGLSVFAFDTDRARERLQRNGWIGEAKAMRILPSTLMVELEERAPFALWREGGQSAVIDADGTILALASQADFPHLPVVSGPGAAAPAKHIVEAVAALPDLKRRVQGVERNAGRRWDLLLATGLRVKLPAAGFAQALGDLSQIAAKNPAALYEISEMDFRVPSQFTVRLKDESDRGRKTFLSWLSGTPDSRSPGL